MSYRVLRVGELIKQELCPLIDKEINRKPDTLITVTSIDVPKDLGIANVRVSVYPESEMADMFKELEKAKGEFQTILGKKLYMKPVPKLNFVKDHGLVNADIVDKELKKMKEGDR
jgi:ribosome-binding factor A